MKFVLLWLFWYGVRGMEIIPDAFNSKRMKKNSEDKFYCSYYRKKKKELLEFPR